MKNVEIAEGGIGRRLSGTKFVLTDKPESDQMEVWVDEDDRKLARLYATSNGTYYPEDYDAYGFSSVTVSIHGGVALPEMPKIEMPDGIEYPALIPEIEMPDGTLKPIDELFPEIAEDPLTDIGEVKMPDTVGEEGSAIVGIDPEDGYTYMVDVDENGNLEVEKVPTGIRVIEDSLKGDYEYGDEIDPTGLRAELIDKDGNVVKTKEYPDGTIECKPDDGGELEVPETDTTKGEATEVSGKKNDQICNANTITYSPTIYRHWTFGGWVEDTNWISGVVGTYDGNSVSFGGPEYSKALVTSVDGTVYAMLLEGGGHLDLYAYNNNDFQIGWSVAVAWVGGMVLNTWVGTPWSEYDVNVPSSTTLLPYEDMKPSKTMMRTNWDNPYNGTRVESPFGVYYIDRPV